MTSTILAPRGRLTGIIRGAALAAIAAAFALGALPRTATASDYPNRPVRFIVSVGAGGATDTMARRLAEQLSSRMGQPFVVENMPEGSGVIAAQTVARAEPDGHTILIGTNTSHAANMSLLREVPYDPLEDFAPISRLALAWLVLSINKDLPFETVDDLIAHARANPGDLSFGSGTGSARFGAELFMARTGIEMLSVPYRGNNAALVDLLGGTISMIFGDMTLMLPQIAAGEVRALGVTSAERSALAPDIPTLAELGIEGYEFGGWIAAFAPAGTPDAIIETLHAEIVTALTDPEFVAGLASAGMEAAPTTPDELRAFVASEIAKWAEIAEAAGVERQ